MEYLDHHRAARMELIALREQARAKRDYATSDRIREELLRQGICVEDARDGSTKWYKVEEPSTTMTGTSTSIEAQRGTVKRTRKAKKRWRNVKKKRRFHLFTEWFMSTFPEPRHVLDIAGGKGRFGLELSLDFGIPCTIVDPNMSILSEYTSKRVVSKALSQDQNNVPAHPLTQWLHPSSAPGRALLTLPLEVHACLFDRDYVEMHHKECDVLVGIHPDEATEPIVDFALEFNKSFAVVPCCVFPTKFPHRRLKNGLPVRTYDEFLCYLQEKDPRIQRTTLDRLSGCNTILFFANST